MMHASLDEDILRRADSPPCLERRRMQGPKARQIGVASECCENGYAILTIIPDQGTYMFCITRLIEPDSVPRAGQ